MLSRLSLRAFFAVSVLVSMLCQGTLVLAGTTGQVTGTALDAATNAPLAGAKVTIASPSQSATATTDARGRFAFLSLSPDTYTVSVELTGYQPTSQSGVTVVADNSRTLNLVIPKTLRTIGRVTSRGVGNLVRPGTTADVYSVDPTQQAKASVAGGGGTQNSAFSALSTVPGVFIQPGQSGYIGSGATLSIRGGDYDQIGFEIDGVPVNRSFDNYPSGPTSSLGQQELQVYTGGAPANAEAQGLSGFVNQVIKTGTYPSFVDADLGIGGPSYYHKGSFEFGGATSNRNFSYYVGVGGYNQDFHYVDQFNGRTIGQTYGQTLEPCPATGITPALVPSCYVNGLVAGTGVNAFDSYTGGAVNAYVLEPAGAFESSTVIDRDNAVNLHFGIPRKSGLKDDIQLLGMLNSIKTNFYDSTNDLGGSAFLNAIGYPTTYADGLQYGGAIGTALPANYKSLISPYLFPDTPGHAPGSTIPPTLEDDTVNNQGIVKLQYTHPFSQSALFRLYGYTYYSNWLQTGPQGANQDFFGPASADYELSAHTRGISGSFIDQLNAQNLLQLQGAYTTATSLRDNNTQMFDEGGSRDILGYVVNSANPTSGQCYAVTGGPALSCADSTVGQATLTDAQAGKIVPATGTCGTGPCEYLVTGNGQYATYNTVKPIFYSASLTDDFRPTAKLAVNGGIRMDIYQFQGSNTTGTAARTFFYNAFNLDNCLDGAGNLVPKEPTAACPAGDTPANFVNPTGIVTQSFTEFQPRLGFTYTVAPTTVLRANYSRVSQAPNSAYEQYNTLQQNAPATLYGTYGFQKYGFTSPDHTVRPPTSNSYDFSIEQQFPGQVALKVSPFYRKTQDQIQNFFLNQQTGFVSGLNVGRQTSEGVEFELDKGDFARDGLAAKLSFTYTNSYINYQKLPNGSTIIDPLNGSIATYNAYTSACAPGGAAVGKVAFGQPLCAAGAVAAAPCYTKATAATKTVDFAPGLPTACATPGSVANPYWDAPVQGFLDPNANYPTFDLFPGGVGSAVNGYGAPFTGTFILNYKKGPFSIAPILQIYGGQRYGAPNTTYGINPEQCTATLAGATAGDPRYPYGAAAGGLPYDATSCTVNGLSIPDPYTRMFDGIGAFVSPAQLQLHFQISYDLSKRVTLVANVENAVSTCIGGTKTGFTVSGACGYEVLANGGTGDIGNQYNPGAVIQPYLNTPYLPSFGSSGNATALNAFGVFVNARVHL